MVFENLVGLQLTVIYKSINTWLINKSIKNGNVTFTWLHMSNIQRLLLFVFINDKEEQKIAIFRDVFRSANRLSCSSSQLSF